MQEKDIILRVEKLSKQYRLGVIGTGTISHDLNRWWHKIRGKEDPYTRIGERNKRNTVGKSNYVWAIKDISFDVRKGEVLGIIGKNGAGKSTLLKILSKVTMPTQGIIRSKGRIASLLEVGTGFHPELTGKENIFLNGAILGMTKAEIKSKFEEIVEFAGVQRYVDTPVKRYSSGMKVRLAFAVAAHLEPEILVVDEVLAVGDAEFQKKAIGKMQDIAKGEGRTVLFVSHDMDAIQKLTQRTVVLADGEVIFDGDTDTAIQAYLNQGMDIKPYHEWESMETAPGNDFGRLKSAAIRNEKGELCNRFSVRDDMYVEVTYWDLNTEYHNTAIIHVVNERGQRLFASNEFNAPDWLEYHDKTNKGIVTATCKIPRHFLAEGQFSLLVAVGNYNPEIIHAVEDNLLSFEIFDDTTGDGVRGPYAGKWPGLMRPMLSWKIKKQPLDPK
ncbi:ABC transporter ATP-binding protein [Kordia sp.]|uniref:ABC transporter ATP-binding protein n=1 Tax=Kordia sp. TaxID=1965332 RepID=UPI0025BC87B6|nr:ABC transporter ATP-binding protein [Kordia sp.]MCH2196641.1 ABC transporter ATP-binding protein [Kordia sp.]